MYRTRAGVLVLLLPATVYAQLPTAPLGTPLGAVPGSEGRTPLRAPVGSRLGAAVGAQVGGAVGAAFGAPVTAATAMTHLVPGIGAANSMAQPLGAQQYTHRYQSGHSGLAPPLPALHPMSHGHTATAHDWYNRGYQHGPAWHGLHAVGSWGPVVIPDIITYEFSYYPYAHQDDYVRQVAPPYRVGALRVWNSEMAIGFTDYMQRLANT